MMVYTIYNHDSGRIVWSGLAASKVEAVSQCEDRLSDGRIVVHRCAIDAVVVEIMPEYLRESHEAARNRGRYPHNGSERAIVDRSSVVEDEWERIVRTATPEDMEHYPCLIDPFVAGGRAD